MGTLNTLLPPPRNPRMDRQDDGSYLHGAVEEAAGVSGVSEAEDDGGGGEGGGGLAGDVRSRMRTVDLVDCPGGVHVLRPLPAAVVPEGVPDLNINSLRHGRGLEDVICRPPDGAEGLPELVPHVPAEVDDAP